MFSLLLAAAVLAPAGPWSRDAATPGCVLMRTFGRRGDRVVRVTAQPLSGRRFLSITLPGAPPADNAAVMLSGGGTTFRGEGGVRSDGTGSAIGLPVPLDRFPGAGTARMEVRAGGRTLAVLAPDAMAQVKAELDACEASALRRYGIDPASERWTTPPEALTPPVTWFPPDSYPPAAIRAGAQGRVIARYHVDADGGLSDCRVVESSGDAALDAGTCAALLANAHFAPARDAGGRAVPATQIVAARWVLPG